LAAYSTGRANLDSVPNLLVKNGERIIATHRSLLSDLNELARPVYHPDVYVSLARQGEQINIFVLDDSRGCPMGCDFCVHQNASGKKWRTKSPGRVVDEAREISELHGSKVFRLGGSYTPPRFLRQFAEELISKKHSIQYSCFCHPTGIRLKDLDVLARSGCRSMFFGIESFVPQDQPMFGKRFCPDKVENAIQKCMDVGIVPGLSMIVPAPNQTPQAREKNKQILTELCSGSRSLVMVSFPGLLPGSRWWKERSKYGFQLHVSEDEYRRFLAGFKIRHLLPPKYWQAMPYSLDGNRYAEYSTVCGKFKAELSKAGVVLNVTEEIVVLADLFSESLKAFQKRHHSLLLSLDADALSRFVHQTNRHIGSL
jgi:radical SAM superfamily enzyme YgiQ (UPF0313 family)